MKMERTDSRLGLHDAEYETELDLDKVGDRVVGGAVTTYTVVPGDTLQSIALRFNTPIGEILEFNPNLTQSVKSDNGATAVQFDPVHIVIQAGTVITMPVSQ